MLRELSVYIHIPFCLKKCLYCDFLSFAGDDWLQREYIYALIREIKAFERKENYIVKTVYIGGGTPSSIPSKFIEEVMDTLRAGFGIKQNCEITVEINPATVTYEKAECYKKSGINRVSVGLQAVQRELLKKLGRIHDFEDFKQSYGILRDSGFENINIDLMFALPNQSLEQWRESLNAVCSLCPEHISCYSLIIEEGTPFYEMSKKEDFEIDDETDRKMYYTAKDILEERGYSRYEISNFAKEGFSSRHNIVYWQRGEYIGFGLGASSFLDNERFKNTEDINKYIKGSQYEQREVIEGRAAYAEFMFLGLRQSEGIKISDFEKSFGLSIFKVYKNEIKKLTDMNLLVNENGSLKLSERGIDVSNSVFVEFL